MRSYLEVVEEPSGRQRLRKVKAFRVHHRSADFLHRVVGPRRVVSIVWTGRRLSSWGFKVGERMVDWRDYLEAQND